MYDKGELKREWDKYWTGQDVVVGQIMDWTGCGSGTNNGLDRMG